MLPGHAKGFGKTTIIPANKINVFGGILFD